MPICDFPISSVASGPRVKSTGRKRAVNPPVVYSTDRPKAVVPGVGLALCCFMVYSVWQFV